MAKIKYFATCSGIAVELSGISHAGNGTRAKDFTGSCPQCGSRHQAERKIEYKSNPSKHACDARCVNATGKIMRCECSCGGRNHGAGMQQTNEASTAERDLRALWTEKGVSAERQDQLIAQISAKASPGSKVGPFTLA